MNHFPPSIGFVIGAFLLVLLAGTAIAMGRPKKSFPLNASDVQKIHYEAKCGS